MSTFRISMVVLYTFLVTLAVISVAYSWSTVTNPFFGTRITNMPAWFELGMSWFLLGLSVAAAVTCLISCWGLAHRKRWSRSLVVTIAWITLFFYPGIQILTYVLLTTMGKQNVPFFVIVSYKTTLLAVLSIATLSILRSKRLAAEYASNALLNGNTA